VNIDNKNRFDIIQIMNEEKLVKLLEEKFVTKKEFGDFRSDTEKFQKETIDFEKDVIKFVAEMTVFKNEMTVFKRETTQSFYDIGVQLKDIRMELKEIREDIKEIKPSVKPLDQILEQHPIERITRLENHAKLPAFVPAVSVE
jgi:hypothetical protein